MSGTNSLFNANPFGNWQSQPQNALAPVNDASAVNSIYSPNIGSPQGAFYGEPGFQYPTTVQPQMAAPVAAPQAAPAAPAAPTPPASPYDAAYKAAMDQNQMVYGAKVTQDPQTLGMMGLAGFPLYSDPRMLADKLAQAAQGTIQLPGVTPEQARDEFFKRGYGSGGGGYGGSGGGGYG